MIGRKSNVYLSLLKSLIAAFDLMFNICFQLFLKIKTASGGAAKIGRINIQVRLAEIAVNCAHK